LTRRRLDRHEAGVDDLEKGIILYPCRESNYDSSVAQDEEMLTNLSW
jgi:hypothetical protein